MGLSQIRFAFSVPSTPKKTAPRGGLLNFSLVLPRPQGISRRQASRALGHIASSGISRPRTYHAVRHLAPLAAIHSFQAFPLRGRWRLRRMRCPPYLANSTSDKALLHLICLAALNIFPSRGRLGTTAAAGFCIHHAALALPCLRHACISPYRASGTPAYRVRRTYRAPKAHLAMFAPKTREKVFFPLDGNLVRRYNIRDIPIVLGGRK